MEGHGFRNVPISLADIHFPGSRRNAHGTACYSLSSRITGDRSRAAAASIAPVAHPFGVYRKSQISPAWCRNRCLVARKIGLGAPYLEGWRDGAPRPAQPLSSIVWPALFWATVTGIIAFGIDAFFRYALGVTTPAPEIHARIAVPWWRSGLASLWAPWAEEIFDRLFLLSLLAWLGMKLFRISGEGRWIALWVANVATSLFFGWYHISNEELFVNPVSFIVALRTVLIVLPAGLAFGWIYIRRGFEAAILSHFFIDVIVHVVRPIVEHGLV